MIYTIKIPTPIVRFFCLTFEGRYIIELLDSQLEKIEAEMTDLVLLWSVAIKL